MKGGDWMSKKLALTICLAFLLSSLAGCQNTAQKPLVPDQTNNNNMTMTADERQVMAEQLANIAENVEGVSRATVVVTTIGMDSNGLGNNGNMTNNNRNMTNNNGVTNNGMNNSINNTNRVNNRLNNNNLDNRLNNPNTNNGVLDNNINNPQPLGNNNMGNNMTENTGVLVMVGLTLNNTNTGGNTNNTSNMSRMNIKREVAARLKASDNRISQVLVTTDANLIKRINNVAQGLIRGTPVNNFRDDINDLTTQLRREQPTF